MELFRHAFKAMGSPCEIQLFATTIEDARAVATLALADVERLEQRYSRYRDDSLLAAINRVAAEGGSIAVDEETAALLNYAQACYLQSDGLFDITSGILRQAWRFSDAQLPDEHLIEALRARIGWDKVRWQPPMLHFSSDGMELDLGGIVKEYAVDRLATLCWNAGTRHGVVNLGGDVRVVGPRPDGSAWRIGIQHPRERSTVLTTVSLRQGAIASSGDYERCIVVGGTRYGHVLNPKTGWPVRHLAAVSVVADLCVIAGSASTIAMLREDKGPEWLAGLGLPHLWVDVSGNTGGTLRS